MSAPTFSAPQGFSGPTWTPDQVKSVLATEAATFGLPAALVDAIAQHESGLNPYAIGDGGTSFGEFQLHQGGELGNLPGTLTQQEAAAFSPKTNADVALSELASVYAADPNADPGQIAARAQRPANPTAYAAAIDSILGGSSSTSTTSSGTQTVGLLGAHGWNPLAWPGQILDSGVSSVWDEVQPFLLQGMFALGAIAVVVVGAKQLVQPATDRLEEKAGQAAKLGAVAA